MRMAVRVVFWTNWKSSVSLRFSTALVTCTTLFMKAILRPMSCARTKTKGRKKPVVSQTEDPEPQAVARTPRPHGDAPSSSHREMPGLPLSTSHVAGARGQQGWSAGTFGTRGTEPCQLPGRQGALLG